MNIFQILPSYNEAYRFLSGVFLTVGLLYAVSFLYQRKNIAYLLFGLLSISLGFFLGLTRLEHQENIYNISYKFIALFYGVFVVILPWFIGYYGPLRKKLWLWLFTLLMLVALSIYLFGPEHLIPSPWLYVGYPAFLGIFVYGIVSSWLLFKQNLLRKSILFFIANFTCLIFTTIYAIEEFSILSLGIGYPEILFFIEGFMVVFVFIMAIQLLWDLGDKYKVEEALSNQMDRWQQTLDQVELVIVEMDLEGIVRYANPYFSALLGYSIDEVINHNWFEKFLTKPSRTKFLRVFQDIHLKSEPFFVQIPVLTSTGNQKMISWSNVILKNEQNKPIGTLGIGTDVTDREKAYKEIERLKTNLEMENIVLKEEMLLQENYNIIGESEAIKYAIQKVKQVASSNSSVLIQGETGVGKELFAHAIHMESKRKDEIFIKVNCASLPKELIESELFGHERGAFTGAHQMKRGRFELADGGTLFLDEIGELPLELQAKLLRVLQSGEYERLGSEKTMKSDVRIVSATNRNLQEEVEKGDFREDLFYRLNVYPITIPPLRERIEDIPLLADYLVNQISKAQGKAIRKITKGVKRKLAEYDWPGNIRELINILERSIIHTKDDCLSHIDLFVTSVSKSTQEKLLPFHEMEAAYLRKVLDKTNWKVSGKNSASEILEMNANTLRSRMQKLHLTRES